MASLTCQRCTGQMPEEFEYCGRCGARLRADGPHAPAGATRQVTVLFADISGFTALAERLDPGELHETMRTVWDGIATEIRAAGGFIEKYIGDAVVAVFGAPAAQDDHPERAQRAALAILSALEEANARIAGRTGRGLALRVGVNTGMAAAGAIGDRESEFGVLGDAVNVAARLEQAAEPGEVLVGDATYRRTPATFAYEPHPPVVAKGKSALVLAWRLVGEAAATPAPTRTPFVGRGEVLTMLLRALDEALAGRGRLLSVVGEAGLGKTRLLDEVLADPRSRGARVDRVRCTPFDIHRPYGAIADLLERLLALAPSASSDHAHRILSETRPEMTPDVRALVLRALGHTVSPPAIPAETRRHLVDRGLRDLLLGIARAQGLVAAVDDVQWADPSSIRLLSDLALALPSTRALILLAHRPDFTPPSPLGSQLRLAPLEREEALALVDVLLPAPIPAAAADEISAKAAGNPLYIEEAARWLRASGAVVELEGGAALVDLGRVPELPPALPLLLVKRLDGLGAVERRVLNAASLFGKTFELELLSAVFGADVDVAQALTELSARGLIAPGPRFQVVPSALRELLYASLAARHREELHGRVGQAFETRRAELAARRPELLAHHFGASAHTLRGIDHAFRAADRAAALHDPAEALHHYDVAATLAARLPDGNSERSRALLGASDAAAALGHDEAALDAMEEALALSARDPAIRGPLRRRAGKLAARLGHIERAAEHLADAERLTPAQGLGRWELTAAKAELARADGRPAEALAVARRALLEARATGDRAAELASEQAIAALASASGALEEARRAHERCAELAAALGDLVALDRALAAQAEAALDRGDLTAARAIAAELLANAERIGDAMAIARALGISARVHLTSRQPEEAQRTLERALATPDRRADSLVLLAELAYERHDSGAARALLDEAAQEISRSADGSHLEARIPALRAAIALHQGDPDEARSQAAAAVAAQRSHGCRRCAAEIAPTLVQVALAGRDLAAAEEHRSAGLEHAARLGLSLLVERIRALDEALAEARTERSRRSA